MEVTNDVTGGALQGVPATEATQETAQLTPAEVTKPADLLSPKLAILAKRERELHQKRKEWEGEKSTWQKERETLRAELETMKQRMSRLGEDPYGVMLEQGMTADQVAAKLMNQPNSVDQRVMLLQEEIKALKAAQEQSTSKFDQMQSQQYEEAARQIKSDITSLVAGSDDFELVREMGMTDTVFELIEETYKKENRLMGVDEAAAEVEKYLIEQATHVAKLKKVQSVMTPAPAEPAAAPAPQKPSIQKPLVTTLSDRAMSAASKPMNSKERRERAIAAFHSKL